MIAETSSARGPGRAAWVADTLKAARAGGVDALVWFEFDKETDWRLADDPEAAQAAATALRGSGWRQGGELAAVERLVRR